MTNKRNEGLGLRTASLVRKQKTCLHLLLVMGIFLYLYSPFLDHWSGNEFYARPHTHVHVSENIISQKYAVDHDQHEHEDGVLCFLDIDALLALLLAFDIAPQAQLVQHLPLVFELVPFYFPVSIIHLALLDPPPTV